MTEAVSIVKIEPSRVKGKRLCVTLSNGKKYNFGLDGGQTYLDHHDIHLRTNYRKRHYASQREKPLLENFYQNLMNNKKSYTEEANQQHEFSRPLRRAVSLSEEIAKELDMTVNDVKESMKNSGRHLSMDAPLVEGEDSNLYDVLRSGESPNPDRELIHESLRTEIERSLETLTPREADVVRLYFGLGDQHPMTLEEIGETFDLTRERVRQIKEKAIRRLKHTSRSKILKTYLG